jgi:hypothetical protein
MNELSLIQDPNFLGGSCCREVLLEGLGNLLAWLYKVAQALCWVF